MMCLASGRTYSYAGPVLAHSQLPLMLGADLYTSRSVESVWFIFTPGGLVSRVAQQAQQPHLSSPTGRAALAAPTLTHTDSDQLSC